MHFEKELVNRLNNLIQDESVRFDTQELIKQRVYARNETVEHERIMVSEDGRFGILGLFNGLRASTDTVIMAVFDHNGELDHFKLASISEVQTS
jgi:hypothetical protein